MSNGKQKSKGLSVDRPGSKELYRKSLDQFSLSAQEALVQERLRAKALAFEHESPEQVLKVYPDLVGAYGLVEAASAFANEKLPASSYAEFTKLASLHVVQKIQLGESVRAPQVYVEQDRPAAKTVDRPEKLGTSKEMGREQ